MLTSFMAPLDLMFCKENTSDFLSIPYPWALEEGCIDAARALGKPVTLCYPWSDDVTATEVFKVASKLKATTLLLPAVNLDSEATVAKVLKLIDMKPAADYKWIVIPQGKTMDDFWGCVNKLVSSGVTKNPNFDSFGLDTVGIQCATDECTPEKVKVPDTYVYRQPVVHRMTHQSSTQNCQITLLGGGNRFGREVAAYRFIRNVTAMTTYDAWTLAERLIQLGLPTQGCESASTLDYELPNPSGLNSKYQSTPTQKTIFFSNVRNLKDLAG